MMLDWVNASIAVICIFKLIVMADKMSKATRHCFRMAVISLALVLMVTVAWPIYGEWPEWMETIFLLSVAWYVLCDKRCPT